MKISFKKLKLMLIMAVVLSILSVMVYSRLVGDLTSPVNEFNAIKGGNVNTGNMTFIWNATPSHPTANISNGTLWTNISGTWKLNASNYTFAAIGAEVERQLTWLDTGILEADLPDNLVFVWGIEVCNNKSDYTKESITLDTDAFGIVFDNNTGCTGNCNYTIIVKAGIGFLSNFPASSLDGIMNSTTSRGLESSACKLNDSSVGRFYCNQTRIVWNGSANFEESIIESNILVNYTISDNCRFTENRTVFVNDAPSITINIPTDFQVFDSSTVSVNITVTGDSAEYGCEIYTNDTGTFRATSGSFVAVNNSDVVSPIVVTSENVTLNVRCFESESGNIHGWAENITILVDITNPDITILSPEDNSFSNQKHSSVDASVNISLNVTDYNADSCILRVNGTDNETISYENNVQFFMRFNASDGFYNWNILCNDTARRTTETINRSITIDTLTPGLNRIRNYSQLGNCKGFTVEFNATEEVNLTFTYGLTASSESFTEIEADFAINQTTTLTFNETYETDFFGNSTICDRAGNCNDTIPEMTITSPVSLCNGWNLWGVYDIVNLVNISTQTAADFVYWWNNTPQDWIFYSSTSTTDSDVILRAGNSVHLFNSVNYTWFRNSTGTPQYDFNLTIGHNYLPLYYSTIMGNLSHIQFRNTTGGNTTDADNPYGNGSLSFNFTFFNVYNNTKQEWVSSIFSWQRNNDTIVGAPNKIGLDVLHVFAVANITVNMTSNGQVFGNWSE